MDGATPVPEMSILFDWIAAQGIDAETIAAATESIREALEVHVDGAAVRLPAAMWLVSSAPA